MNKMIITRWKGRLLTAQFSGKEALELGIEEENSILDNIYIGKVNNLVKNLNSAFVTFGDNLTGYYSLTDNPVSSFTDGSKGIPKCGDEIVVQVAKEAVKTKDPVLTGNLNFPGKYAVLTSAKATIGFSAKIGDAQWKESIRPQLEAITENKVGVIVRTNAYKQEEALLREISILMEKYQGVTEAGKYRTCGSLLYGAEPEYIKAIRNTPVGSLEEIITDDSAVYENLKNYKESSDWDSNCNLRFYEDSMLSLSSLYSIEAVMDQACQKKVWLKSGGYLIIEYTEAMVVIDVNTGKYSGKKKLADTIRMINLEAAKEICHQMRLRNLSGIIMVDFIDMKADADKALLMETLRTMVKTDSVKTTVVDMTQLNLVEITRKKEKKPLWEQLSNVGKR